MTEIVTQETIDTKIWTIRGKRVILDRDLAVLYGVTTGNLNKAVKRNLDRFPEDFMFRLSPEELKNLIFQFGPSSWGGVRKPPYAFTDYGIAMLSGVLNSKRAVLVNIQIMRAFTRLRQVIADNTDIRRAIQNIEKRLNVHDREIQIAFAALKNVLNPPNLLGKKEYSPVVKKMGFGKEKHGTGTEK